MLTPVNVNEKRNEKHSQFDHVFSEMDFYSWILRIAWTLTEIVKVYES